MKTIRLFALLLAVVAGQTRAQDLKSALVKMQDVYTRSEKLHIVMEVKVFETIGEATPAFHEKADIKKENENYRYTFSSTEMLLNEKYQIVVDKESRDIIINKRDQKIESQVKDVFKANLDSILAHYNAPEVLGDSAGATHYRVFQKHGVVDQIDLYVDNQKSILLKMEYRYRDGQFVSVVFEMFDTTPSFDAGVFDDKNYVLIAGGRVKPSARLQHYRIFGEE
jgi:outer membrane lipoprotein-sorting protein